MSEGAMNALTLGKIKLCAVVLATITVLGAGGGLAAEPKTKLAPIVKASGVKAGLCVHLGVTDGKLTAELSAGGKFLVHGLAADAASLTMARKYIQSKGVYGRVSVERSSFKRLPYADNLVNLIVAEDLPALLGKGLGLKEGFRVLTPDGVLCFGGKVDAGKLKAAGFKEVKTSGAWTLALKPRPSEMGDWTHYRQGPDGNMVAKDTVAGVPAHLQWVVASGWSRGHGFMMHRMRAMVSAGGRVFYAYDEAPSGVRGPARLSLIARDAYNGMLLWKRPVTATVHRSRGRSGPILFGQAAFVATAKRVYVRLETGGPLRALDALTGKDLFTYEKAGSPGKVVLHKDALLLQSGPISRYCAGDMYVQQGRGPIRAVDVATGKVRWSHPGGDSLVVGDGKAFFLRGREVVCIDAASGKERWRSKSEQWPDPRDRLSKCVFQYGVLAVLSGRAKKPLIVNVLSARDGKHLWGGQYREQFHDVYFAAGKMWVHVFGKGTKPSIKGGRPRTERVTVGLDPATGAEKQRIAWPHSFGGHHDCYPNRATERFLMVGLKGTTFVDNQTGKVTFSRVKGDCSFGSVPANGLFYQPPGSCTCFDFFRGFVALASSRFAGLEGKGKDKPHGGSLSPKGRLEEGPGARALPQVAGNSEKDAWPTLRADDARSGSTASAVPAEIKQLWLTDLGGRISAPTVAGGMAFVAKVDGHQVLGLDAATGSVRWRYTTGGRVDSPPTVYKGLCLFGCRDGWVYCLRAKDGKLVWRFRAALGRRLIGAFSQLESAWPVHGSVLVTDGLAYFAAGRSPHLDGVRVYALKPESGEVVWERAAPRHNQILVSTPRYKCIWLGTTCNFDLKTGKKRRYVRRPPVCGDMLNGSLNARKSLALGVVDRKGGLSYSISHLSRPKNRGKNALNYFGTNEYKLSCSRKLDRKSTQHVWSVQLPVRVQAMLLAGETLFMAGPPDVVDKEDYWAALDGKKGAELWAVSAAKGEKLSATKLDALPVFNGMAAAGGRLYLSTQDGKLRCFGKK
jgi:outer membrane protein assembly factor BamB